MVAVMMIAVLVGIAIATFTDTSKSSRRLAIEGDAAMMNKAVQSYLGSGGSLAGVTSASGVIAKLKTKSSASQTQQIAGLRGPFLDQRLDLVPATTSDDWSITYDAGSKTFKPVSGRNGLVTKMNESLAEVPVVAEDRRVSLALAKSEPWVWDYADKNAGPKAGPVRPIITNVAPVAPINPATPSQTLRLNPPTFSLQGFQLGPLDFPQKITLTNVNPAGSSELYFRMNGGAWAKYNEGISLPLQASTKIETYATPLTTTWRPSVNALQTYTFKPGQLAAPTITPATGSFQFDDFPKSLTLAHTNPAGTALLQYRIGSGGAWVNYTTPVALTPTPSLVVSARALPLDSQRWVASSEVGAMYDLVPQMLLAPVFAKAAGLYPASDYPLSIALTNPNPAGSSTLQYREKGGSWQTYTTPISLSYNQLDVTLEARATPVDTLRYLTSPVRPSRYQLVKSSLKPPVVTPPGGYYPYGSFPTLATIVNPNPANTSEIWYRFGTSGVFLKYDATKPPALSRENYLTTLTTYARSLMTAQFSDSIEKQEVYETIYFVGGTGGKFHDPTADAGGNPANMVTNLPPPAESNLFKWGKTSGNSGFTQSTMQFDGTGSFKAAPGEWFFIGKLTYYNGTIVTGSGAGGVSLRFAFNLAQPSATTTNADYLFKLVNTKNNGTEVENADYVYLPTLGVPFSTTVGGRKFKLDVRFGETTANGFSNVSEFHVFEEKSATGSLYGRITEVP